ncbi:Nmdmc family protein [Megaselia abdita]
MAKIIDGKQVAAEVRLNLKNEVQEFIAAGNRAPQLTAILIGNDPASQTYVNNKMKAAQEIGINSCTKHLPSSISEDELLKIIDELNENQSVDAILVQLPVPDHINERKICNAVKYEKDVDGFNEINVGRLALDMETIVPCTPLGVRQLLKYYNIETKGKNAVVVGRSKNVSLPIAMMLHTDKSHHDRSMDATVTICHRYTPRDELKRYCQLADIIVTATGIPGIIQADMVKPGACVIDIGITRIPIEGTDKTKLVGDVDFEAVKDIAGFITPVPGGVGPMTVAMLMKTTVKIAKNLAFKKL